MSEEFYSQGAYLEKHPNWHVEDAAWKASNILKMMKRHKISPSSIVEIGCGAGEILKQLQVQLPAGVKLDGYEVSPQAFEMARPRSNENLHFHLKGLDEIPVNPKAGLALMIDVFEHVEDFYGFIKKSKAVASQMIFHIPLDLSVQSVWRGYPLMRKRINSGHIHYFTKDTALASVTDCGFRVIDSFYTGSYIDRPSRTMKSRLAKFPRKVLFGINPDFGVRVLGGYSLMVLAE